MEPRLPIDIKLGLKNIVRNYHKVNLTMCTGGSHLSQIFWEHENLSGLSIIQLIQLL